MPPQTRSSARPSAPGGRGAAPAPGSAPATRAPASASPSASAARAAAAAKAASTNADGPQPGRHEAGDRRGRQAAGQRGLQPAGVGVAAGRGAAVGQHQGDHVDHRLRTASSAGRAAARRPAAGVIASPSIVTTNVSASTAIAGVASLSGRSALPTAAGVAQRLQRADESEPLREPVGSSARSGDERDRVVRRAGGAERGEHRPAEHRLRASGSRRWRRRSAPRRSRRP